MKVKIMPASLKGTLETILVVDNDEMVLKTVVTLLKGANFHVFSAERGAEAIKLAEETEGPIHLLLSEVELPDMSGPALGQTLKKNRADIHVMLMSGQDDGNLLVLNYGWAYIQKKAVPAKLVQMVTDVLHAPDRSQLGDEFDSAKDTGHKIPGARVVRTAIGSSFNRFNGQYETPSRRTVTSRPGRLPAPACGPGGTNCRDHPRTGRQIRAAQRHGHCCESESAR
jgi:DNA-binding response OmpR family regulator